MSNPKFLNVEKRVPYNVRLPKRLIDKLNSYAELTGNTTTNIVNTVLDDYLADKIVLNDYLDNIGGVTIKIPFATHQKYNIISNKNNLIDFNTDSNLYYHNGIDTISESLESELFEVKKIPNNLDIYNGDSYVANKKILKFNHNAIHSGIELFIYNIAEIIFADAILDNDFESFVYCLYCLYFEVTANESVNVYLIDYLTAINLLSASGNENYKNLIIAAATELSEINDIILKYETEYAETIDNLTFDSETDYAENYDFEVDKINKELHEKYLSIVSAEISGIADKYNSNNIIKFGSDIFSRLSIKEIEVAPTEYFDDLIDKVVSEKIDEIFDDKIGELLKTENRSIEKLSEIENMNNDLNAKIDKINEIIESELNKTNKH